MPAQYTQDKVKNCPNCYGKMYVYSELQDQSGEYTILSIGNYKQPAHRFLLMNRSNFFIACGDSIEEAEEFAVQFGLKVTPQKLEVEVKKKGNSYDFQLVSNREFLSDEELDDIFQLVIDFNLALRQKTGEKVYFRHSLIGVRKYYVEDMEFDSLSSAYEEATKQLDGDWLAESSSSRTEEMLSPHQLIEIRDI